MNKAELKEKLEQKKEAAGKAQLFPVVSIYDYVIGAVDQLDEARPNLSGKYELKEFLDRVLDERHYDSFNEVYNDIISFIDDQLDEPEKVVVPDDVGEWINNAKEDECSLIKAFWLIFSNINDTRGNKTEDWVYENPETFARAWLDGYTVEEKKYTVAHPELATDFWFLTKNNSGKVKIGTNVDYFKAGWDSVKLTKAEIENFDKKYMAFAEEVK